ncbi:unnamed protein product, partial [Brugia pahangi]|uniref:PAC domain-containing protein n=1 Tax=Brugia pahangi TaxID=6280 RepID=A0A0N4TQZ9_BRUPA
ISRFGVARGNFTQHNKTLEAWEINRTDRTVTSGPTLRLSAASGAVSEVLSEGKIVLSRTNENEVFTVGYIRDVTESENDSSTTQMNTSERMWQMLCLVGAERQVELLQAGVTERNTEIGELKATIQNLRRKAAEDLEKQKMELLQSINESLAAAEHNVLCKPGQSCKCESEAIDSKEFYRLLKKRLITIVEKFKLEAENPQLTRMGEENIHYAVDEFEMAIKIILFDHPHLASLAERFMVFLEAETQNRIWYAISQIIKEKINFFVKKFQQATSLEGNLEHGYSGLIRNSLMDFKSEMNSEIYFMLQKFNNNQTNELCKVVWSIISRLDATEQKLDNGIIKDVDQMMNILTTISSKHCDDRANKEMEDINVKLETLFEAFDDFRRDIKVIKEERKNKLKKAKTEQLKLKTTCAYVDYLSGEHKKLEKQVKNVQSCFEKIEKGFHSTLAMQTTDSAANKTRLKSNENLSAAIPCSKNGKSANMMKENEQRAKGSTEQETDCQIIQKKSSFKQRLMNLGLKLGFIKQVAKM